MKNYLKTTAAVMLAAILFVSCGTNDNVNFNGEFTSNVNINSDLVPVQTSNDYFNENNNSLFWMPNSQDNLVNTNLGLGVSEDVRLYGD